MAQKIDFEPIKPAQKIDFEPIQFEPVKEQGTPWYHYINPIRHIQTAYDAAWEGGRKLWDIANEPLLPQIKPYAELAASTGIPFQRMTEKVTGLNPGQLAGEFASEMTSPLNVGLTAATAGEYAAANAGRIGLTRGLNALQRASSAPIAIEGGMKVNEGWKSDDPSQWLLGGLEFVGGLAGMQLKPPAIDLDKAAALAKKAGTGRTIEPVIPPQAKPKVTAAEVVEFNKTGRPKTFEEFQLWKSEIENPAARTEIGKQVLPPVGHEFDEFGVIQPSKVAPGPDYKLTERGWVKEAVEEGKRFVQEESGELNLSRMRKKWGEFFGRVPENPIEAAQLYRLEEKHAPQITKLLQAISDARPIRAEQEYMYSLQRGERITNAMKTKFGGEAGFRKRLSALKGDLEKIEFDSIRPRLGQSTINNLFDAIDGSPNLLPYEKIRASTGLAKIMGEMGGQIPQRNELDLLDKVFGGGFTQGLNDAGFAVNPFQEPIRLTTELVNLPRALMASTDLSAPLRQGIGLIHQKAWWTSWDDMVKSWGSQRLYDDVVKSIQSDPIFEFAQDTAKLRLTDMGNYAHREEQFMSKLAEKIPGVKRSERAYLAYLNKLRFDTFKSLMANAEKAGLEPSKNLMLAREIASYVNNASGRGSLGKLEDAAVQLNSLLFSPRLISSRIQMLNPGTYVNASPFVRKQYLKSLFSIATLGSTVTTLGYLAGGEVENNPNSSDFGKVKIGNTRIDPYGGFQQYLVAAHRLITGETKSTTTGREYELGARYGSPTRLDVGLRFGQSKLNPTASFIATLLQGKDFRGAPLNAKTEVAARFVPILIQDLIELYEEEPDLLPGLDLGEVGNEYKKWASIGMLGGMAGLGMGVQTYKPRVSGTGLVFGDINR